jgi:hypothetical protein
MQFGDDAARDKAVHLKDILGRLANYQSATEARILAGPLEKMAGFVSALAPKGASDGAVEETRPEQVEEWRQQAMTETNYL